MYQFGSLCYKNCLGRVTVNWLNGPVYVFIPSVKSLLTEIGGFAQGGSVQKNCRKSLSSSCSVGIGLAQ